jgi:spore germination protein GerM
VRRAAAVVAAVVALAGCGVGAQSAPEEISIPRPTTSPSGAPGDAAGDRVTVWFVRGSRLEAAERPVEDPGVDAALDALAAGPTRAEVVGGLRTALSPQSLTPGRPVTADSVVTVGVSREFTEVAGGNQLLAVAQVVFTVTEVPGVEAVRITTAGSPVEVPTDEGLTDEPVGRGDYASVVVPEVAPASPPGADRGTAPPALPS